MRMLPNLFWQRAMYSVPSGENATERLLGLRAAGICFHTYKHIITMYM